MKKIFNVIMLMGLLINLTAQDTIVKKMVWKNQEREYIIYNPETRVGNMPVMFCLHALGSTDREFFEAKINKLADTTGWLIVSPQALSDTITLAGYIKLPFENIWGAGVGTKISGTDYILNEDIDDVGFLTALLDSVKTNYSIDNDSVFFFGFSMGGFMTQRMAIEKGNLITAAASVSGTIGKYASQEPVSNVNIIHIHGTEDQTIGYNNAELTLNMIDSISVGLGAEATVRLWNQYNQCDTVNPIITHFLNKTDADSATYTRYLYKNGKNQSYNAFIKVNNGKHDWHSIPDSDIDYVTEVYRFFTNTMTFPTATSIKNNIEKSTDMQLYPNPAQSNVTLSLNAAQNGTFTIYDMLGKKIYSQNITNVKTTVDVSQLMNGIYMAKLTTPQSSKTLKLVIQK